MKAAQLRHRIEVFRQRLINEGCYGADETYISKGSCWAEVKSKNPALNDEQYHDRRIVDVTQYAIKTRHNIGFSFLPTDVIVFNGALMRIQGITNVIEHDFQYSLSCFQIERDSVIFADGGQVFNQAGTVTYNQAGEVVFPQAG